MKPHKHAELIKAWADGAEIEYRFFNAGTENWGEWQSPPKESIFIWQDNFTVEYRIKPEPKHDDSWLYLAHNREVNLYKPQMLSQPNLKLTFDGETGELKSAEVLK